MSKFGRSVFPRHHIKSLCFTDNMIWALLVLELQKACYTTKSYVQVKNIFFLSYCQLQCKALKTKIYTFSDLKLVACNCNDHMKKFLRYFGFRRLENQITLFTVPRGHLNLTSVWEQKLFTGFSKGETVMIMNTRSR